SSPTNMRFCSILSVDGLYGKCSIRLYAKANTLRASPAISSFILVIFFLPMVSRDRISPSFNCFVHLGSILSGAPLVKTIYPLPLVSLHIMLMHFRSESKGSSHILSYLLILSSYIPPLIDASIMATSVGSPYRFPSLSLALLHSAPILSNIPRELLLLWATNSSFSLGAPDRKSF